MAKQNGTQRKNTKILKRNMDSVEFANEFLDATNIAKNDNNYRNHLKSRNSNNLNK